MKGSPNAAGFNYVSNSPIAHVEICRELGAFLNPDNVNLSLWKDGRLRGGIIYERFNHESIFVHIVGFEPSWFTRKFLWLGFYYPFEQLGVGRIFGLVASNRAGPLAFFKHLGFTVETTIKKVYRGADQIVLVMEKDQCKWLKMGKKNGFV